MSAQRQHTHAQAHRPVLRALLQLQAHPHLHLAEGVSLPASFGLTPLASPHLPTLPASPPIDPLGSQLLTCCPLLL